MLGLFQTFAILITMVVALPTWAARSNSTGVFLDESEIVLYPIDAPPNPNGKLTIYRGIALQNLSDIDLKSRSSDLIFFDVNPRMAVDYGIERADALDSRYIAILRLEVPSELLWSAKRYVVIKSEEIPDLTPYVSGVAILPPKVKFRWEIEDRLYWRSLDDFLKNPKPDRTGKVLAICNWLLGTRASLQVTDQ